ncbi:hypothetical protein CKO_03968 [Citrobacter koseri ATCC BAA-895]|uniref:Uncharacterized protein n=1 Tax=Citrobacter koseri (strain ATCC BAA-895 / CDC 4225-83 / SGSC4696) TaxID=290338 RepID=A8ANH6_CITK8|nr:hypothetical protein CKO_03968 [Citrobacter koseri ATCC BAA-895]
MLRLVIAEIACAESSKSRVSTGTYCLFLYSSTRCPGGSLLTMANVLSSGVGTGSSVPGGKYILTPAIIMLSMLIIRSPATYRLLQTSLPAFCLAALFRSLCSRCLMR